MKDITKEKLRDLLEDAEWEGGMLVTQADWQRYLKWALDQIDAKDAALVRYAEPPSHVTRPDREDVPFGKRMPKNV